MRKAIDVQLPTLPNFIRVGLGEGVMLPVSHFSEKELKALGAEWTKALIKKSHTDRK